jgi:S1-C subfamily serine protease
MDPALHISSHSVIQPFSHSRRQKFFTHPGDADARDVGHDRGMAELLESLSNQLADAVAAAAPAVVQVLGSRRPASGIAYADGVVVTTARALGRDDGVRVRTPDGRTLDAELAGWDPATHLAVLRVGELGVTPAARADAAPRVGQLALAIGRSWSNAVTATLGNVAVIGGPLQTGRGRKIEEIIRTTAPMHGGFAGGALVDAAGRVLGIATAAEIRGLGVVIPSRIAWAAAEALLTHGQVQRGYLGLAGQSVRLAGAQRDAAGTDRALLVIAITAESPAARAGLLVGDVITRFDGEPVDSADRLLELLDGDRVGRTVSLGLVRGGAATEVAVVVGGR